MLQFGMPERIRTDNGVPFASVGLLGLSRLSLKWIRLGIAHERIDPSQPQPSGRHQRIHRTLKEDTANPSAANLTEQQERFSRFRKNYNHERPHEALALSSPGAIYISSARSAGSVRRKLSALSSLFDYLCERNAVLGNPGTASNGPRPITTKEAPLPWAMPREAAARCARDRHAQGATRPGNICHAAFIRAYDAELSGSCGFAICKVVRA
jgi:Integrase core domain